jgi:hypothetical protein
MPDNRVIGYDIAFAQTSALIGCRADKSVRMDGMRFMIEMRDSKNSDAKLNDKQRRKANDSPLISLTHTADNAAMLSSPCRVR